MLKLFDIRSPFFAPLWRRVVVVAALGGWGLFEVTGGNTFWAILFLGVAVYCGYIFFVDWHFEEDEE